MDGDTHESCRKYIRQLEREVQRLKHEARQKDERFQALARQIPIALNDRNFAIDAA